MPAPSSRLNPARRHRGPTLALPLALSLALALACGPASEDTRGASASSTTTTTTDASASSSSSESTGASATTSTTTTTTTTDATTTTTDGATDGTTGDPLWRSELYPDAWDPDAEDPEGRFLHDFSYAGYHHGEAELGADLPAMMIDVVADFAADPSGTSDATAAFQAAIDAAAEAGGAIILIPEGLFRVDDSLAITSSRIVLRGLGPAKSRLWFTRFAGMSYHSHIEFKGPVVQGDDHLLASDAANRSRTVTVADASGLAVGDDVVIGWTITDAFIDEHGMTGVWMAFNGAWQPFFWRTITAIDGDELTVDVPIRYPAKTRDMASVRAVSGALREVAVESLGIADAVGWDDAWSEDQVHVIGLDGVVDAWIRDVATFISPGAPADGLGSGRHLQSGGVIVRASKQVTIAESHLALAQNRGGSGNGYLFEVRQSSEVLVRDCVGEAGRHNFIQNWGFGATGIVWLRVHSKDGRAVTFKDSELGLVGFSEFHHSLATANLIDQSVIDDGWGAVNRGDYSTGAGHAATQSVLWNASGGGTLRSRQYGHGYVIGPAPSLTLETDVAALDGLGTEPEDWVEGPGKIGALDPPSLYEDQRARRLMRGADGPRARATIRR